ncbi:MAG: TonB family protein, partial [Kiritimatiellae bacterium]|nr:TonB family protein [Kiritimatiellia bacterium]
PRPRRTIRPDYPAEARRRGIEGETTLELTVDAAGSVSSVTVAVSSGHPELDVAAVRAVKAAEFTPAQSGGSPVESSARLKLVFRLK